jgi:Asp-tRNA(Asn)/Glu-tRNA(Gln) amidotransferase A subunit family amidase/Asp-tRNA(Asn)/Glu-tRNA(Gln) amidotransferase C subunit
MPSEPQGLPRRLFLQYLAAAGAVSAAAAETFAAALAQNAAITKETIADAEKLAGLSFSDAQREQMAGELSQHLQAYERLRSIPLDNGVPPALVFEPLPPDVKLSPERKASVYSEVKAPEVPDDLEQVAFLPVLQLAKLIAEGDLTSVDLTQMYLARLKRHGEHLHCVITLMEEQALAQAAQADREIAAGKHRGPLHGIPWGAKDLLATKGVRTTWGAEPYENQMIDTDATVVERLSQAGAVLVAKLSLGALAMGDVWFGGLTRNPWDDKNGSSGSSAGSAAATVAGLVGFAIGTETLGSIVSPCTRCGATGLRPTFGRVSRYGAMALSWSMDKLGPLARSVEDCAAILEAIAGPDGRDPSVIDAPFGYDARRPVSELRVGYLPAAFEGQGRGAEHHQKSLAVLRGLGVKPEPVKLPDYPLDAMGIILSAEAATAFDDLTRSPDIDRLKRQTQDAWPNLFRSARTIPAVEYLRANRLRTLLCRDMYRLMQKVDVLVTPSYAGNILMLTNLTGNPCVVLPNGADDKDRPVSSLSFIGQLFGEAPALQLAHAYQEATDFHRRHPSLEG